MKLIVAALAVGALALPVAAHAASPFDGSWKGAAGPTITFKVSDGMVTRTDTDGLNLDLKTDGSFNALQDKATADKAGMDAISVHMKNAHTMVDVAKRNGKVIETLTSTVSKDGKSMRLVSVDAKTHKTTVYKAKKV
jgi:xylose isomerase